MSENFGHVTVQKKFGPEKGKKRNLKMTSDCFGVKMGVHDSALKYSATFLTHEMGKYVRATILFVILNINEQGDQMKLRKKSTKM
jgi:hypothetical protein